MKKILSERESEVLSLLGRGYKAKDIASKLFISINTVKTHIQNMRHKLGLKNQNELIVYFHNNKILKKD
jgi:DNA-binding NarL/FixJ family response regulator